MPSNRRVILENLTFRNYYEIPTEGIVSTSPADASDENSPTTVHVSGGTQVDRVSVTSQSTEARFLQGSIASDYLAGAGVGSGRGAGREAGRPARGDTSRPASGRP